MTDPLKSCIDRDLLRKLLPSLNPRQQLVIALRFGIGGGTHTYTEIADILEVTKAQARILRYQACGVLRRAASKLQVACYRDEIYRDKINNERQAVLRAHYGLRHWPDRLTRWRQQDVNENRLDYLRRRYCDPNSKGDRR